MQRWISSLFACTALALAAVALAPAPARAQCSWGCTCINNACGCNMNGNGGRCDATATGCVVSGCSATRLFFAPDGSVARLASVEDAEGAAEPRQAGVADAGPGGTTRWEAARDGRSLARHCSGVVLARYYPRDQAAAIREASRTLTL